MLEGFARVEKNGKWNFINQEGRLISNEWFNESDTDICNNENI